MEVAYREVGEPRHRLLHRRVAEAIEQVYGRQRLDDVAGLLASHFAEGNQPERAAPYAFRAGQLAARAGRLGRGRRLLRAGAGRRERPGPALATAMALGEVALRRRQHGAGLRGLPAGPQPGARPGRPGASGAGPVGPGPRPIAPGALCRGAPAGPAGAQAATSHESHRRGRVPHRHLLFAGRLRPVQRRRSTWPSPRRELRAGHRTRRPGPRPAGADQVRAGQPGRPARRPGRRGGPVPRGHGRLPIARPWRPTAPYSHPGAQQPGLSPAPAAARRPGRAGLRGGRAAPGRRAGPA